MIVLELIRAIIFRLWPILLIILVLWVIYWLFIKKTKDSEALPPWQSKLWIYTFITTVVFLLLTVVFMVIDFEEEVDMQYIPAHQENGVLIPGKMIKHEPQKENR